MQAHIIATGVTIVAVSTWCMDVIFFLKLISPNTEMLCNGSIEVPVCRSCCDQLKGQTHVGRIEFRRLKWRVRRRDRRW